MRQKQDGRRSFEEEEEERRRKGMVGGAVHRQASRGSRKIDCTH
jgi:hypothetical protein